MDKIYYTQTPVKDFALDEHVSVKEAVFNVEAIQLKGDHRWEDRDRDDMVIRPIKVKITMVAFVDMSELVITIP